MGEVAAAFVRLSDPTTDGTEPTGTTGLLCEQSVHLLGCGAASVFVVTGTGVLGVDAWSNEGAAVLARAELRLGAGPAFDAFSSTSMVAMSESSVGPPRWGRYLRLARAHGYGSVISIPLYRHEERFGVLDLLGELEANAPDLDLLLARGLADAASVGISTSRRFGDQQRLVDQLQMALGSRVKIEQAKGILSERARVDVDTAFHRMRRFARANRMPLVVVAGEVIAGRVQVIAPSGPPRPVIGTRRVGEPDDSVTVSP